MPEAVAGATVGRMDLGRRDLAASVDLVRRDLSASTRLPRRDLAALAIAAVAFALGAVLWSAGQIDPGFEMGFGTDDAGSRIIVATSVQPSGVAAQSYLYPSDVIVAIDGNPVGPGQETAQDAFIGTTPYDIGFVPRAELPDWEATLAKDPTQLPGQTRYAGLAYARSRLEQSLPALLTGLALFGLTLWWLRSGRGGATLEPLAIPIAAAGSTPLFLVPAYLTFYPAAVVAVAALVPAALLPFAESLAEHVADPTDGRRLRVAALAFALAAVAAGSLAIATDLERAAPSFVRWALASAVVLVPGVAAARPLRPSALAGGAGGILQSTELAVAATLPPVALLPLAFVNGSWGTLLPLLAWVLVVLAARRFTVRPLARLATRASLQRDLVVAATEAERARIAADIHDDALQDLTMLVRRLDAAGDDEGAAMARTVADRLRAICGDLRLPILDDLGAGPALEWLVDRIGRISGGEVRLVRDDEVRAPADVELAVFRVAQEALSNAVRHGRPPIVVRYRTASGWAALSVDDAGSGIEPDAAEAAGQAGHFGLLGMAQRAEQIGAILDVRRWPAGGTHVALEWRAR